MKQYKFKTPCDEYYRIFRKKDPYYKYKFLSPFELKNILIKLAKKNKSNIPYLNAGRGNPNFLSTLPREAFSILNMISAEIAQEEYPEFYGLGVMPLSEGISKKFYNKLNRYRDHKEAHKFLKEAIIEMIKITGDNIDDLIHQIVIATLGSFYPDPPQIQPFNEKVMNKFLESCIFHNSKLRDNIHLFATEGATAAIMYTFNSLHINGILNKGDKIGILTPIFSPYLEIPDLYKFELVKICVEASEEKGWEIPEEELIKIKDKDMKALFMVNPTNPTAQSLTKKTVKRIGNIIRKYNPNLIVLDDNVYAPFVKEYNSLFNEIPENTIGVYSLSKYFGVTGWRLGVIILHKNNIIDKKIIPRIDGKVKKRLEKRYKLATIKPNELTFMERLVLDSREVAEAHTGGISTPQQMMMTLFAIQEIMDKKKRYNGEIRKILRTRINNLSKPIRYEYVETLRSSNYYIILDLLKIAETLYGKEFKEWFHKRVDPLDIVFLLAKKYKTIILPGVGFAAPPWSVRVSLANLATKDYEMIGKNIKMAYDDMYKISSVK